MATENTRQKIAATQRTPGPWKVGTPNLPNDPIGQDAIGIEDPHGYNVADVWGDISELPKEANAAFIVQACNAHDELVAALEWYAEGASDFGTRARSALAKVS